jgi:hypothetical protein
MIEIIYIGSRNSNERGGSRINKFDPIQGDMENLFDNGDEMEDL